MVRINEWSVFDNSVMVDPDLADRAAKAVAGQVAQAPTPTPEEVAACKKLLDMLGLHPDTSV